MKLCIFGSREFTNYHLLESTLDKYINEDDVMEVVSGGARGADKLGEKWANLNGVPIRTFPADWNKLGKSAGYIRNQQMADYATHFIGFHCNRSRGTQHMIDTVTKLGKPLRVIQVDTEKFKV